MFSVFSLLTDRQRQPQDTIAGARLRGGWRCSPVLYFSSRYLSKSYLTIGRYSSNSRDRSVYTVNQNKFVLISLLDRHTCSFSSPYVPPSLSHTLVLKRQRLQLFITFGHPTLSCFLAALSFSFCFPSAFPSTDASSSFPNYLYEQ